MDNSLCGKLRFIFLQDLGSHQWYRLPDMPGPKCNPRAAQLRDWLVVLSGYSHVERYSAVACRRVFAFHTLREVWVEWVKTPNYHCGVASNGDRLIIIGGTNPTRSRQEGPSNRAVYQLNEDRDGWVELPMLPRATAHCAATALNNKLYVLGPLDSRPQHSASPNSAPIQVLDLAEGVWSEITLSSRVPGTLHGPMHNYSLVAWGDLIVSDRMVAYNTTLGESVDLPNVPDRKTGEPIILAVVNDQLLAVRAVWSGTSQVHVLGHHHQATWKALPSMTTARCYHSACTVNGVVYVMGGKDIDYDDLRSMECFK